VRSRPASTIIAVADAALAYHWNREEFVRAWEAGVFDQRVELVEGIYGRAGYRVYWVVTPDVIYEHTQPGPDGYRVRVEHRRGDHIAVGYADLELSVDTLIG